MKRLSIFFLLYAFTTNAGAQTLFTYRGGQASTLEFLAAYKKSGGKQADRSAMQTYLQLYAAAKLKVAEAKAQRLDTGAAFRAEDERLRQQLLEGYRSGSEAFGSILTEARMRSKEDIRFRHIFIRTGSPTDTAAGYQKLTEVQARLRKGEPFAAIARQHSDDPSAATNGGDGGWATLLSLPYALESMLYTTPVGKVSTPYRSAAGYHLLQPTARRPAKGRWQAAQILLALPPSATDADKAALRKRIDSVHTVLFRGGDFAQLATTLSHDAVSSANGGRMPDVWVGQYDPVFDSVLFSLSTDGALSRPFPTPFGWHLVKRLRRLPSPTDSSLLADLQALPDRVAAAGAAQQRDLRRQLGLRILKPDMTALQSYTDSVLYGHSHGPHRLSPGTPLLQLDGRTVTVGDWTTWVGTHGYEHNAIGGSWQRFVDATVTAQWEAGLQRRDPVFAARLHEFRDGSLFFEIMQRQVWGPSQTDTAAQRTLYAKAPTRYRWPASADAVLFYAANGGIASDIRKGLMNGENWKLVTERYTGSASADSGRYALADLPGIRPTPKPTDLGETVVQADGSVSFVWIVRSYPAGQIKSLTAAQGEVATDLAATLDKTWILTLVQKYKLQYNAAALKKLGLKVP